MPPHETQSFFTPPPHGHYREPILASSYNLAQILLKRSGADHLFVPIRSMQYLAIIEPNIFWFVDSMAYAVENGDGGRIITLCWKPETPPSARDNLEQPVAATVIHYGGDQSTIQARLRGEFLLAMQLLDQRYRDKLPTSSQPRILPFTGASTT